MCQTVEERRTVRDSQGKEETTVTHSGGPGSLERPDHQTGPGQSIQSGCFQTVCRQVLKCILISLIHFLCILVSISGGQHPFSDLRDDDSLFSKFFGGFR